MKKKVAILQSNYIPWKGYFDLIGSVDEFIFYDQVQYTKNDWRNRNKIKTPQGLTWITVPTGIDLSRKISEVEIDDKWQLKHWRTLSLNYTRAPYFKEIAKWLEPLYLDSKYSHLSQMNQIFIREICKYLGIETRLVNSSMYDSHGDRVERLLNICKLANADEYVSGPAAQSYIDPTLFETNAIILNWFDYGGYKEYNQLWGDFHHGVSILDLLFNCGSKSRNFMKIGAL